MTQLTDPTAARIISKLRPAHHPRALMEAANDAPANTCPPCNSQCEQGRHCPAVAELYRMAPAEACSDIGADDIPARCRPLWSVVAALGGWAVLIVGWAIYSRYY